MYESSSCSSSSSVKDGTPRSVTKYIVLTSKKTPPPSSNGDGDDNEEVSMHAEQPTSRNLASTGGSPTDSTNDIDNFNKAVDVEDDLDCGGGDDSTTKQEEQSSICTVKIQNERTLIRNYTIEQQADDKQLDWGIEPGQVEEIIQDVEFWNKRVNIQEDGDNEQLIEGEQEEQEPKEEMDERQIEQDQYVLITDNDVQKLNLQGEEDEFENEEAVESFSSLSYLETAKNVEEEIPTQSVEENVEEIKSDIENVRHTVKPASTTIEDDKVKEETNDENELNEEISNIIPDKLETLEVETVAESRPGAVIDESLLDSNNLLIRSHECDHLKELNENETSPRGQQQEEAEEEDAKEASPGLFEESLLFETIESKEKLENDPEDEEVDPDYLTIETSEVLSESTESKIDSAMNGCGGSGSGTGSVSVDTTKPQLTKAYSQPITLYECNRLRISDSSDEISRTSNDPILEIPVETQDTDYEPTSAVDLGNVMIKPSEEEVEADGEHDDATISSGGDYLDTKPKVRKEVRFAPSAITHQSISCEQSEPSSSIATSSELDGDMLDADLELIKCESEKFLNEQIQTVQSLVLNKNVEATYLINNCESDELGENSYASLYSDAKELVDEVIENALNRINRELVISEFLTDARDDDDDDDNDSDHDDANGRDNNNKNNNENRNGNGGDVHESDSSTDSGLSDQGQNRRDSKEDTSNKSRDDDDLMAQLGEPQSQSNECESSKKLNSHQV